MNIMLKLTQKLAAPKRLRHAAVALMAVMAGASFASHSAKAVPFDFVALAAGNEGPFIAGVAGSLNPFTPGGGPITVTATASGAAPGFTPGPNGTVPFLDDVIAFGGNEFPGGLGVCTGAVCTDNNDDNTNPGETLILTFSGVGIVDVVLSDITFNTSGHSPFNTSDGNTIQIFIDGVDQGIFSDFTLGGALIDPLAPGLEFEFIALQGSDFYIGSLNAESCADVAGCAVPEPGALALFGVGLVGLGLFRRRRKKAA